MFLSIVILYGRFFTSSERRIKLEEAIFREKGSHIIRKHRNLMQLRHAFVAHAGKSDFESYELMIEFDGGFFIRMSDDNFTTYTGECVEEENIMPVINVIEDHIKGKIEVLKKKLELEISLLEQKAYLFFEKAGKKQPITDSDLK
jgi:hypothetical protein